MSSREIAYVHGVAVWMELKGPFNARRVEIHLDKATLAHSGQKVRKLLDKR